MKLPFIKFFPRDWQADSNLRVCSLEARGLWFEMLCIMAQAPRYGYLTNGDGKTPLSDDALTRLIGCSKDDLYRADFEDAWKAYPDKSGKTKAFDAYKKHRAHGDEQSDILEGIARYKVYVAEKRTKGQDLGWRYGQTFFNQANWRDEWVVADLPPVIAQEKKTADTQKVITFKS